MRLAICSINRWKYSETFIQSHYKLLGDDGLLLCDGYLPTTYSTDHGKTFKRIEGTGSDSENLVAFLQEQRVTHILAEYGPSGVSLMSICKNLDVSLTVHFHGYDAYRDDVLSTYGKRYSELFDVANSIIVVSSDMEQQLQKLGCPNDKLHRVRYGVNTNLFAPSFEKPTPKKLLYCGRFVAKKNPELVVKAFSIIRKRLPDTKLTMIGDGELLEPTKRLARDLNVFEAISFLGALTHDEVAVQMKEHCILLQPSDKAFDNDSEGTPLSMLEAMSTGLVVIGYQHAGIAEVIDHEHTGILVQELGAEVFAQETIDTIQNQQARENIGTAAREYILNNHGLDQYLFSIHEIVMRKGE